VIAETARRLDAFPRDRHFHIAINVAARHFANGELLHDLHNYWFSVNPVQQLVVELTERDVLQDGDQHMAEHLHLKASSWRSMILAPATARSRGWKTAPGRAEDRPLVYQRGRDRQRQCHGDGYHYRPRQPAEYCYRGRRGGDAGAGKLPASHGVDVLQGFYYARPMPVEAFPAWLASREAKSEGPPPGAGAQDDYSSSSLGGRVTTAHQIDPIVIRFHHGKCSGGNDTTSPMRGIWPLTEITRPATVAISSSSLISGSSPSACCSACRSVDL
jgi:hypothetical protein